MTGLPRAHPIEPDGMTQRVEVAGSRWELGLFVVLVLMVLFALALLAPQGAA